MANYKVLARKYRPNNLAELRGQDVFVQILNNSIKSNKLAHAYLLTGIRGVGKTSIARIIANTISCNATDEKNNLVIPCGKCKNCLLIEKGNYNDILEFDAASHTGVSDIRDIIDSVHYSPVYGRYKIYIIDEVHMLSNSAFNALLKILEEPPQDVIFIFATTEIRKLPLTVISRCQRFDLHRFSVTDIVRHLEYVCGCEQIECDGEALETLAKHSSGSMRDALTILESVVAMAVNRNKIDMSLVYDVLGINDVKSLYSLLYQILSGDTVKALELAHAFYSKGVEITELLNDVLVVTSRVSKYIASGKKDEVLVGVDSYEKELIKRLCRNTDVSRLTAIWQILLKAIQELKCVDDILSAFEMLIVRCCYAASLPSLDELIANDNGTAEVRIENSAKSLNDIIPKSFDDIVKLFYNNKEMIIYHQLRSDVICKEFKVQKLVLSVAKDLPKDFTINFKTKLKGFLNQHWDIELDNEAFDKAQTLEAKELYNVQNHAMVKEILNTFPGTKIKNINVLEK